MTIARDFNAQSGYRGDESGDGPSKWNHVDLAAGTDESLIPVGIRMERLDAQIRSFERAGYRLETKAGLQAIVMKPRTRRPARDAALAIGTLGLALVPALIGAKRVYHRVVITVDQSGAVRLA